jgi:hypothetical protein
MTFHDGPCDYFLSALVQSSVAATAAGAAAFDDPGRRCAPGLDCINATWRRSIWKRLAVALIAGPEKGNAA